MDTIQEENNVKMWEAIDNHNTQALEWALKAGADVHVRDWKSDTPLHRAINFGNKESIQILINAGANVNAMNSYNYTPLHYVAAKGKKECVITLLKAGADFTMLSNKGETPESIATDPDTKGILCSAREQKELQNSIPDPVPNSISRRRM